MEWKIFSRLLRLSSSTHNTINITSTAAADCQTNDLEMKWVASRCGRSTVTRSKSTFQVSQATFISARLDRQTERQAMEKERDQKLIRPSVALGIQVINRQMCLSSASYPQLTLCPCTVWWHSIKPNHPDDGDKQDNASACARTRRSRKSASR